MFTGHILYLPLLLFVAGSFLSSVFSRQPLHSLLQANEWFHFLVFVLALCLYRRLPALTRHAVNAFAILTIFLSVYGFFEYFALGHRDLEHRITGPTAHVMTYSGILLALTLLFFVFSFHERKLVPIVAVSCGFVALVLTFTRGAWLGWMAGAATFLLLRRLRLFAYAVPVAILALTFAPEPIFGRFISSFDLRQSSNLDRLRMLEAASEMIKDRPLTGVGPGQIKEAYPLYRASDAPRFRIPHLHNNIAQLWAERGLVPLLAYLMLVSLFAIICVRARRHPASRPWGEAGLAITVGLFVAGMFEFNFGDTEVLLTMLDVSALIVAMIEQRMPEEAADPAGAPLLATA